MRNVVIVVRAWQRLPAVGGKFPDSCNVSCKHVFRNSALLLIVNFEEIESLSLRGC